MEKQTEKGTAAEAMAMTRVTVVRGILMLFVCWVAVGCSEVQVLPVEVEQRYEPVPCPEFVADTTIRI